MEVGADDTRNQQQERPSSSAENTQAQTVPWKAEPNQDFPDLTQHRPESTNNTYPTFPSHTQPNSSATNTNGLERNLPANSCSSSSDTQPSSASHFGVTHVDRSVRKSTKVIPGVEHVFFEEELVRMEEHKVPAGMDIVVLAVDNSKPSDMAFQFYVENVNRPSYFLHLVHHSNYWGNYEPMDGGPSPKHCMELMEKENAKVKVIEDKYRKLMEAHNIQGDFICLRGKDAWHDIIQHQVKSHNHLLQ
ncbi:hypothetical protein ElyMa_005174000 [Elysia marginata]|uniref:UspA domain-containing protein n=1 Tax=Elysia marginata TaxID=1093978 RepID=A0AAV4JVY4_9GAST|nr:hypothetical protein ElyMa_005174000 [Elysia marginata]